MRCPYCATENIQGVDSCSNCGAELAGLDLPEAQRGFSGRLLGDRIGDLKLARPIVVAPKVALSTVDPAPISTSSPMTTVPFECMRTMARFLASILPVLFAVSTLPASGVTNEKPSEPMTAFEWMMTLSPIRTRSPILAPE